MLKSIRVFLLVAVCVFSFGCVTTIFTENNQAKDEAKFAQFNLSEESLLKSLEEKEQKLSNFQIQTIPAHEDLYPQKPEHLTAKKNKSKRYIEGLKLTEKELTKFKQDIIKREGFENQIYLGRNGVPTIGAGQTFGYRNKDNTVSLYTLDQINHITSKAGIKPVTQENYYCLVDMVGSANYEIRRGSYSKFYINVKKYSKNGLYTLADVKLQKRCTDNDYVLNKEEKSKLLSYSIEETYKKVTHWSKVYDINMEEFPSAFKKLALEFYYRSGRQLILSSRSPAMNKAYQEQNYLAIAKELYARSNGDKIWQNDLRNAELLLTIRDNLSEEENKELEHFIANDKHAQKVNLRIYKLFAKYKNPTDGETIKQVTRLIALQPAIKVKLKKINT